MSPAAEQQRHVDTFDRQELTSEYYSEGIAAGDLNRDGHADVVYGPYWFAGPDYKQKHEIYPVKPQPRERYADHFFAWVYDFNGDGWNDVLTAGFPGTPGYVYENPGAKGHAAHWPKHKVVDIVSNEAPQLVNLVGDERPELVCTRGGFFGYATFDPKKAFEPWTFHPISKKIAPIPFGHGLGVGDIDGDGLADVLMKDGWFRQPKTLDDATPWELNRARFATPGGAEMYAYDVDGDGDNDVITSLAAHDFGLAWHEQVRGEGGATISFRQHLIMGDKPEANRYGLVFTELHSVNVADIDGDGLKDIVTGKTYYSHHQKSPMWDAGAVVYWFRLVRGKDGSGGGVDWVPHKADGDAGVGRQLVVHDLNGDKLPDLLAGGMKGGNVLLHRRQAVDAAKWEQWQPKVKFDRPVQPVRRPDAPIDAPTGRVPGAMEGEVLTVLRASGGKAGKQKMGGFAGGRWSGDEQLFWTGAKPGDKLELHLEVPADGVYDVAAAFTVARDYATVQASLDDRPLGETLDLYDPQVTSTGEVKLGTGQKLSAGKHRLVIEIKGANPAAARSYMVGLDYVRLIATRE